VLPACIKHTVVAVTTLGMHIVYSSYESQCMDILEVPFSYSKEHRRAALCIPMHSCYFPMHEV
jgi:hypothetical protein